MRPGTSRGDRALAVLYDQHLRLLAAHFNNMDRGRSNSAAHVSGFFHALVDIVRPSLFVEAGAYRAEASRRVHRDHPGCRVVAFEANPHNVSRYAEELRAAAPGVEYLNLAVSDVPGEVVFQLRRSDAGGPLRPVTGNSGLLRRLDADIEYDEVRVPAVSLDSFFEGSTDQTVCLWIDVEGASEAVLRGATRMLSQTAAVMIEVEETRLWRDQWRALDVIEWFVSAGFVPLARDVEYERQHNMVFVRDDVYEHPDVLFAHELHLNYLVQHMGV